MATRKKATGAKAASKRTAPKARLDRVPADASAARQIDERIAELGGWRGETLDRMRALILEADPGVLEEWKWSNPVWSHDGIICTGEAYAKTVKLTFAKGASLPDPSGLFNSSLAGNTRRAIDIHKGECVDARAFKALIKAAVALNGSAKAKPKPTGARAKSVAAKGKKPVRLLSGGNPQIAKADGDAPVQEFIAAMPGWKRDVGKRIDKLVERAVPDVRKAVKWNTPMYRTEHLGFFLAFHVYERYVKVIFFRGADLRPLPPDPSKDKNVRYVNVHEGQLDEVQMEKWVRQAAKLKGYLA